MTTTKPTPAHLLPTACYVCGLPPHEDLPGQHAYWSNAGAALEFREEERRARREALTVSFGARFAPETPEARYVRQHRPY